MTVLIIGAPEETHSAFIHHKITARGKQAVYFDTRHFPAATLINMHIGPQASPLGEIIQPDQPPLTLESIEAVYWRYHMGLQLPQLSTPFLMEMAQREIESALGSLFRNLPCRWVNSPQAVALHVYKAHQLFLMHQAGIRVPQTLISNDPQAVWAFYEAHHKKVIYKPVRGGAHAGRLTPDVLTPEKLADLGHAPSQFQELIEGVDIRVYAVKEEIFAGEIRSRTLDFRDDPAAPIVPVTLPDDVAQDCLKIMDLLGLVYTGIDIRRTPTGEYVFLEANPCPMFIHFEQQANYPISDRLVDLLIHG